MKKILTFTLCALLMSVFFVNSASAITFEVKENVVITQNILDDAYVLAGNANIDADIFGDLYIAGGVVTINGNVQEDLVVSGGMVSVYGDVAGDLRVAGGTVSIYGNVGDDVLVAGGKVDIGKGSVVGGSLMAGAAILTVDGVITEEIRGGMGMFLLNGTVNGDVIVTIEDSINISEAAKIGGDFKYSALIETKIPENVVAGEVSFNKFERENILEQLTYLFFIHKALSYLSALLILLLFVVFAPRILTKSAALTKGNLLKSFGVGLLALIAVFVGSLILMITVVGVPLGLMLLVSFVFILFLSKIFVSSWLGSYFLNAKKNPSKVKLFFVSGFVLFVYYLIGMIPFVGWVINAVLFTIGVGILVLTELEYWKALRSKKLI